MKNMMKTLLFIFLMIFDMSWAANILGIFAASSKSHFGFNAAIMKALANAGHNVTVLAPFSEPQLSDKIYFVDSSERKSYSNKTADVDRSPPSCIKIFQFLINIAKNGCHNVQKLPFVQNLLRTNNHKYELMFVEMLPLWECYLPLAKKLQIPVISTLATRPMAYTDWKLGNSHHLMIPHTCSSTSGKMSFFQRFDNVFEHLKQAMSRDRIESANLIDFYRQYYPNYEIETNKEYPSLSFVNTHISIFPRPMAPVIIEVAGIHVESSKRLAPDMKKFMEEAEAGVILFSFGSRTEQIGNELKGIFKKTFARLSQRVIWKFDNEMGNLPSNVLLRKWVPQQEILAHNNTKLFITHCGANSLYEAIHTATPLVMIPNFGDQNSNAVRVEELGVGVRLNLMTITEEKFYDAIQTVLHDRSYKTRMELLSDTFKHRPISPHKAVVYWTEYVLRYNGTKHLQTIVADMPIYQYLILDILAFVIISTVFVLFVAYLCLRKIRTICTFLRHPKRCIKLKNS